MMDAINPTRDDAPEFAKEWDGDECACAQCADTNATLFYRGEPWCWQCYTASLEDDLCRRADLCAADRGVTVEPLDDTSLSARIREIGNQLHNLGCKHQNDEDLCERLAELRGQLWEIAALQPTEAQPEPVIHAIFETVDLSVPVTGTTAAKVKRIELNDDGSKTVVIDHWPLPPTGNTALVERAIKLAEWCEDPEQLDDREAGSVIRDLVAALARRAASPEAQVTVAGLTRAIPAEGDTIDRMRANLWVTPDGRTLMNSGDVRLYWLNEGDVNTAALRALGGSN